MQRSLISLLSSAVPLCAAPLSLVLDGDNVIQIEATVNGVLMDTASTIYSGIIEAEVAVEAGQVTEFEMLGGTVVATDASFLFEVPMFFSQKALFLDLKALPLSPNGSEMLTESGKFSASEHFFRFQEGCVELVGDVANSKTLVVYDPFDAAGTKTGVIILSSPQAIMSSLTQEVIGARYDAAFSLPLNAMTSDADGTFTLTRTTSGTVTASGVVSDYVHPFYEWAASNAPAAGDALSFTADADGDGVQDGISWALGFPSQAPQKTLSMVFAPDSREFTFSLPGRTRLEVLVQSSPDLSPESWKDLPTVSPIPAGTSGPLVIAGPADEPFFLRFVATFE